MKNEQFPPKVDAWLGLAVLAVLPIAVGRAWRDLLHGGTMGAVWALVYVGVALALLLGLVWPMAYTLEDARLVIRAGRVRRRIPYDAIDAVSPTRSLAAAPALSRDRLRVRYRKDGDREAAVLLSPADEAAFLDELHSRCPSLRRDGRQLLR